MNENISILMAVITATIFIGGLIWGNFDKKRSKVILSITLIATYNILAFYWLDFMEYEAEKRCLNNKFKYKMEIKYQLKNSIYVPTDTIYVKIK